MDNKSMTRALLLSLIFLIGGNHASSDALGRKDRCATEGRTKIGVLENLPVLESKDKVLPQDNRILPNVPWMPKTISEKEGWHKVE